MKIAIVRQKYVSYGGAEKFSRDYILQLANAGHEVHIFACEWAPVDLQNVHFHKVPTRNFNALTRFLSFAFNVEKLIKRERFDLIQSHERTFYQDIYRAGDGCHKEWLEIRKRHLPQWRRLWLDYNPFHRTVLEIEKYIFTPGNYRKIVAISKMVKQDIRTHYQVPDEDIAVVYNGVSLQKFSPGNREAHYRQVRQKLGVPNEATLLLTVGSGFERKGLKYLLQSLEYLRSGEWRLLVVGRGDWNRYRSYAPSRFQDQLIYRGTVEDIEAYYAATDVFILPSIYEPFGNANLEALASGLPAVISRNCGAAELVTHKLNGMILENPSAPEEIAEHVNFLFDRLARENMGREARKLAENFPREKNADNMMRLYETLQRAEPWISRQEPPFSRPPVPQPLWNWFKQAVLKVDPD